MEYKVVKPVYLDGKEYSEGAVVIVNDSALAEKLLSRGTLQPVEGGSESTNPLTGSNDPAQPTVPEQPPVDPTVAPVAPVPVQPQPPVAPQPGQPTPEQINQDMQVLENASNPSETGSEGEKPNVQIS